ncbi:MAG TPA: hypothetical protein PK263_04520 [bacterium]|nr:hypothetical protein [bacterium]
MKAQKKKTLLSKGFVLGVVAGLALTAGGFLAYSYAQSGKIIPPSNCFDCRKCCDASYRSCVVGCHGNNFCVRDCVTNCTKCYGDCQKQEGN